MTFDGGSALARHRSPFGERWVVGLGPVAYRRDRV